MPERTSTEVSRRIANVAALSGADRLDVLKVIAVAGLDPATDFRFENWSGVSFAGLDLTGFDFTGARLHGCDFTGAKIARARFDQAEIGRVIHDPERAPTLPGLVTPIAAIRTAGDWNEFRKSWRRPELLPDDGHLPTGAIFQDAPFAPEMVVVPSGSYLQGDETKPVNNVNRREVTIAHRLAVGRFPVTFEEWDFCHADGGTKLKPKTEWGRDRQPVMRVSWDDITNDYLPWLNRRLGLSGATAYRLLSEAEWEYCCRAGTETAYSFGDTITKGQAQFSEGDWGSAKQTVEVGSFPSNAWGLHDMHGNVWEWCEDAWFDNYQDAPVDGAARRSANTSVSRVLRGGSWGYQPGFLRSASRDRYAPDIRGRNYGFRLARTLNPTT